MATETKLCALSEYGECDLQFEPRTYFQLCCCKRHADRRRWLKRKARIKVALAIMEHGDPAIIGEYVETGIKGGDNGEV